MSCFGWRRIRLDDELGRGKLNAAAGRPHSPRVLRFRCRHPSRGSREATAKAPQKLRATGASGANPALPPAKHRLDTPKCNRPSATRRLKTVRFRFATDALGFPFRKGSEQAQVNAQMPDLMKTGCSSSLRFILATSVCAAARMKLPRARASQASLARVRARFTITLVPVWL